MPWVVAKSAECPAEKPWAVLKESDGSAVGCHESEGDAIDQLQALNASEAAAGRYERRTFAFRLQDVGADGLLRGYAAVFEQLSDEIGGFFGGFRERIARGAFDPALKRVSDGSDAVMALLNHDPNYVIASTADGSLALATDEHGLLATMRPLDTQTIRDLVVTPVKQGLLRKMSFGFSVSDEHSDKENGEAVRVIDKIGRLFDVSVVTFPAYPQTEVISAALVRLGVNPERLSTPERIAFRSILARHLPAAPAPGGVAAAGRGRLAGAGLDIARRRLELERQLANSERTLTR